MILCIYRYYEYFVKGDLMGGLAKGKAFFVYGGGRGGIFSELPRNEAFTGAVPG